MRYQAALRPDMISRFDSKALPNFVPPPNHGYWLNGLNRKNETLGKGTLCRKRSRKGQRDERREWVGTPVVGYTAGTPPRGIGGAEGRTLAIRALGTRGLS